MFAEILGKGGFSCVCYDEETQTIYDAITGSEKDKSAAAATTNNRMEILGLLTALELAINKYKNEQVYIYCDSSYCVNMFNFWISNWASNNWIGSNKKQVKNLDLVKQLYEYKKIDFPNFIVEKINGHQGVIGNELADAYAKLKTYKDITKLTKIFKENDITLEIG